ncbi:MAG: hypothetical protein JNK81_05045 [Anaerolineales bacterium]|nr:hypothetical protein [Anaerolineales bacterium]
MPNKPTKAKSNSSEKPKSLKKKPMDAARATIIASVLGLIGVTVGAVFTYWSVQTQVYAPIEATQTAQSFFFTQTALAPTSNPLEQASPTIEALIENPIMETNTPQPVPKVNTTLPRISDLNLVPTMYIGYLDIKTPEVHSYPAKVSRKQTYLWTYYWCAKFESILDENLTQIQFSFFIDDVQIPESNFLVFKDPSTERWYCQKWVTMLSGWDVPPPKLSVVFDIPVPLSDGVTTFPIGRYEHEILISYID